MKTNDEITPVEESTPDNAFKKQDPTRDQEAPEQVNLDKIPTTTLAKKMRHIEDIMADYIASGESELTLNEQRLLDLTLFEKTGKRLDKFKEEVPKPKGSELYVGKGNNPDRANKKTVKAEMTMAFVPGAVS